MEINVLEDGTICLKKVFNSSVLKSCMGKVRLAERQKVANEVMQLCLNDGDTVKACTLYRTSLNPSPKDGKCRNMRK
jgi:hypothetical protein